MVSNTKVSPGLATDVAIRTNAELYVECSSLSEDGIEDLVKEIVGTANKCPLPKEERKCVKCCVLIWEQIFRYAHNNVVDLKCDKYISLFLNYFLTCFSTYLFL